MSTCMEPWSAPVEVLGRGHHRDAALPDPRCEHPEPTADVQPDVPNA